MSPFNFSLLFEILSALVALESAPIPPDSPILREQNSTEIREVLESESSIEKAIESERLEKFRRVV